MARTRPSAKASESSKATGTKNKSDAAKKSGTTAEARAKQEAEQTAVLVKRVVNHPAIGESKEAYAKVATDLKITAGKAAFLLMQHHVANGDVPSITGKDDETLLKNINAARLKADRFSAWGWLAARSGKNEGWIKTGLAKMGLFTPKAENIATKRAEANPKKATTKTEGTKTTGKRQRPSAKGNA
jgi:hypothetical protein